MRLLPLAITLTQCIIYEVQNSSGLLYLCVTVQWAHDASTDCLVLPRVTIVSNYSDDLTWFEVSSFCWLSPLFLMRHFCFSITVIWLALPNIESIYLSCFVIRCQLPYSATGCSTLFLLLLLLLTMICKLNKIIIIKCCHQLLSSLSCYYQTAIIMKIIMSNQHLCQMTCVSDIKNGTPSGGHNFQWRFEEIIISALICVCPHAMTKCFTATHHYWKPSQKQVTECPQNVFYICLGSECIIVSWIASANNQFIATTYHNSIMYNHHLLIIM